MRRALPHNLNPLLRRSATPESRSLALSFMKEHKALTSQELYKLTTQYQEQKHQKLQQEGASTSNDPADIYTIIPSMRYLKKFVMNDLQLAGEVEKCHTNVPLSEEEIERLKAQASKSRKKTGQVSTQMEVWRWQLKTKQPPAPPQAEEQPFGTEVGVGEDWSHLNKRRQRARVEKVARDVEWMKVLEDVKEKRT